MKTSEVPGRDAARPGGLARITGSFQFDGPRHGALVVLVAVLVFAALRYDRFYSPFHVKAFLSSTDVVCIGLIAVGMTFVISLGEIDLSVAGTTVLASIVAAMLAPHGLVVTLAGAVAVGLVVGAVNGALIALLELPSFIVTLAALLALKGLALILSGNDKVPVDFGTQLVAFYDGSLGEVVPYPFLVLLAVFLVAWVAYSFRAFGRHILAIGGNRLAAELMGLRVARSRFAAFLITGTLAGLAGAFLTAKTTSGNPLEATGWELNVIAAVVLGGTLLTGGRGSVPASLVGVLLLASVFEVLNFENGQGALTIDSNWQNVVRGLFLLLIMVVQAGITMRGERVQRRRIRDQIAAARA
ncbi:ABC transporter permease [Micromonospora sp. B11E3]|uniref:ABC transporter permease n=1 Tax=unclassified Micromonospora TaxID=2617518 RepID=UPI00325E69C4